MKRLQVFTIFMVLLVYGSAFSFADTYLSVGADFYQSAESYNKEDYGRNLNGGMFVVSLTTYPEELPFGWYIRIGLGSLFNANEWKNENNISENKPIVTQGDTFSSTNILLGGGLSYMFQITSVIYIPVSLGAFCYYNKDDVGYYWYQSSYDSKYYSTLNFGLLADMAFLINPVERFTMKIGINLSNDFLRWERGFMQGGLREITDQRYQFVNEFGAFIIGFNLGLGYRFDTLGRKKPQTVKTANVEE